LDIAAIIPPQKKEVPPYIWWEQLFSPPECAEIIRIGESKVLMDGQIGNGMDGQTETNRSYRCVKTCAITPEDAAWAYQRLTLRVAAANYDHFQYDLCGMHEQLVFLRYDEPLTSDDQPGHYNWHQDIGGGMSSLRKLSTVTQLSDPRDYDGCRLRLFTNTDFDPEKIQRGDTLVFPSYLPHCVTPITRGTRYSLVSWVTGPAFR
jgi:PKHD-type hydroxylase